MSLENIQELMSILTLDEKIGQLSMGAAGFARTGPIVTEDVEESVRSGQIRTHEFPTRRTGYHGLPPQGLPTRLSFLDEGHAV